MAKYDRPESYRAIPAVKHGNPRTAYEAVCMVARELQRECGLLQSHGNDVLVHDKAALNGYAGEFLWACSESGTTLQTRDGYTASRRNGWHGHAEALIGYLSGHYGAARVYRYSPRLGMVRLDRAEEVRATFRAWDRGETHAEMDARL